MLFIQRAGSKNVTSVSYDSNAKLGAFLRNVLVPLYNLEITDDGTVLAKVHTPDLRVVFNRESRNLALKEVIQDNSVLIVAPWPKDTITMRSLEGNAALRG